METMLKRPRSISILSWTVQIVIGNEVSESWTFRVVVALSARVCRNIVLLAEIMIRDWFHRNEICWCTQSGLWDVIGLKGKVNSRFLRLVFPGGCEFFGIFFEGVLQRLPTYKSFRKNFINSNVWAHTIKETHSYSIKMLVQVHFRTPQMRPLHVPCDSQRMIW